MRFQFPHSHGYPNGRVSVEDDGKAAPDCLVEFGDGVTVIAEWRPDGDAIRLAVPGYRTARGALVSARTWRVARGKDGHWRSGPTT
ncbi:hypothetical protein [Phenylobacterium sp.]|uniref:hypothetical protein n=1 Tax=Phenylobacterium sp. TaxID=1871053 RepID=UPI00301D39CE